MRRLSSYNYKKLVPLKRLAETSSYSFGYVSILVQRKKLKAKKIGNKYYSTPEWFDQYLELHARDEKRLLPAAVRGLSSDETLEQPVSESMASARLKDRVDNLVEQALKKKLAAPEEIILPDSLASEALLAQSNGEEQMNLDSRLRGNDKRDYGNDKRKVARHDNIVFALPVNQSAPAEKNLAEVLNEGIASAQGQLFADLVEPEKKLSAAWSSRFKREEKNLKASAREAVKKFWIADSAAAEALADKQTRNDKESALKNFWIPACAGMTKGIAGMTKLIWQTFGVFKNAKRRLIRLSAKYSAHFEKINRQLGRCQKIIKRRSPTFKTSLASAIIYLAIFSFINLAPLAAAGLSLRLERGLSQAAGRIKELAAQTVDFEYLVGSRQPFKEIGKLAGRAEVVIPGKVLSAKVKISLTDKLIELTSRTEAVSLKLENNLKRRNQILARRLAAVKEQIFFITDFWSGRLVEPASNIKLAVRFLPARTVELGNQTIMALRGFLKPEIGSENIEQTSPYPLLGKERGKVAGVSEASSLASLSMPNLLALANTTSRRGREVIGKAKYGAATVLTDTAERQKELSLSLGRRLAKLTLAGAEIAGLASQSGRNKLARLENTISRTNNSIEQSGKSIQTYSNNGQKYLASEAGRSLGSLGNLYSKIIDRIIPESLKNRYARLYEQPRTIIEKEVVVKETTVVKQETSVDGLNNQRLLRRLDAPRNDNIIAAPPRITNNNLSITGNAAIGGELNVSGPAYLKNKLTVSGQAEFDADVTVAAALTAKSLLVTDYAQFAGSINAKDLTADNLTSRNNLTVVGGSFIGGNELIQGNLKVAGTFQAGHTEFSSLGVTGQLGAGSLSAGSGGLVVGGNANFNGDSNLFAGGVTINNILNINKETPAALTVGDGVNNIFTVNTKDDVVTIAATLNLSGNTQYSGNMDLNAALDLDTASTSALTVGDGTIDNFKIDTVNDILTLGYSSTTDQINVNAKQMAFNFASSTAGLLINYDGTGNIIQAVDNGVNRFILDNNGNITQTASTTGYAYVLNQAGTGGNLLDIQDEGVSRFTIADLGVANIIASSTTGTALTVKQNSTGDILNLFDGDSEVLTVIDGGNLGLGTTTPNWLLQAAGARPFFTLSDTGASANLKHWFLSSQGGNLYIGTSSDALATSTISALTINSNGYVGIATTSPAVNFAVGGHCVTGDTRLRRRRKRRKKISNFKFLISNQIQNPNDQNIENCELKIDWEYIYDEVRIDEIKPGDEIASLDEKTGKLVWSRVNGLLDMGVKEIYKLTTASGKQIRTTSEHPYLLRQLPETGKTKPQKFFRFEVDQSGRMEELNRRTIVAAANQENSFTVVISAHEKRALYEIFRQAGAVRYYATFVFASLVTLAVRGLNQAGVKARELVIDNEYIGHENRMKRIILASAPDLEINFTSIGRKSPAHYAAYYTYIKELKADALVGREEILNIIKNAPQRLTPGVVTWIQLPQKGRSIISIAGQKGLSRSDEKKAWTKVKYLKVGQEIAVAPSPLKGEGGGEVGHRVVWDKITKIEILPPEQVYDIEVEGTHNFIGNDIVAHNTYITGGLGVGQVETGAGNITGTGRLAITSTSATSTISTGGLTVGTSQFVVQQTSGNVGIGTTSPGSLLSINGITNFTAATSTFYGTGGLNLNDGCFAIDGTCVGAGGGGSGTVNSGAAGYLSFYPSTGTTIDDTDALYFDDTNNRLGIGTTTPTAKLNVYGGDFALQTTSNSATAFQILNAATSSVFTVNTSAASTTISNLTVSTNSNLGTVVGGAWQAGTIASTYGGTGTSSPYHFLYGTGSSLVSTSSISDVYLDNNITIAGGVISGTSNTMSLGSDATGDVYYRNSSGYLARLAIGSGGYVLGSVSGLPGWVATTTLTTISGTLANTQGGTGQDSSSWNGPISVAAGVWSATTSIGVQYGGTGLTSATAGWTLIGNSSNALAATSTLFISSAQNVGLGTTTPNWKLQVAGTRPFFTLSDTGAAANLKHWFLSSQGGNLYIGTSSDALATSTISALTILSNSNIGVGTTTPFAKFAVQGGIGADYLTITGAANATSTFGTGGLNIGNGQFVVQQTSGNVGIGITAPATGVLLHVAGVVNANSYRVDNMGVIDSDANSFKLGDITTNSRRAAFYANGSEYLSVATTGNVGIGTTTPNWLLQAAGARPFFTLSDTGASANLKHWFLSSQGGNLYIGTSSDALATSTISALTINSNGYVGIATTSPAVNFAVGGHCVTGDTRLRRRRRKSKVKIDDDYIYDEVQIKDIEPGDEIASLDEKTGKIVWSRVNGLLDMGVKEIYKLTTESGKTIRTTENHPYYVNIEQQKTTSINEMAFDASTGARSELVNSDSSISEIKYLSSADKNSLKAVEMGGVEPPRLELTSSASQPAIPTADSLYQEKIKRAKWTKVKYLKVGQEIAVANAPFIKGGKRDLTPHTPLLKGGVGGLGFAVWDKITKIEILPPEQVYDIEVAGTHNFIGNDIVAHNTYITGGLGVGQVETTAGNITGTGRLAITGASATSTIAGGLAIETSGFVYDYSSGNVGIGTAGPSYNFEVTGTSDIVRIADGSTRGILIGGSSGKGSIKSTSGEYLSLGANNTVDQVNISTGGNLGIGTTTPNWLLQAAGARPFFTLSDTGASANLKHWFLSSQGGNLYIGTSSDALATSTISALTILSNSNIGVGTTTPFAKLSVAGNIGADYITAVSITATSTFPYLTVSTNSNLGTVVGGTWQAGTIASTYGGTGTSSPYHFLYGTGSSLVSTSSIADVYLDNNITIAGGVISGTSNTMSLGSDATGDVYYRNSSGYLARLAIGSGGYVLGSVSGLPGWVATTTLTTISGTLANTQGGTGQDSSSWNGPVSVANGTWTASTSIGVVYGGTGLTSATAGYALIGNSSNALAATSTLFISSAQNVGIGTTTPSTRFFISSLGLSTAKNLARFEISNMAGGNYSFIIGQGGSTNQVKLGAGVNVNSTSSNCHTNNDGSIITLTSNLTFASFDCTAQGGNATGIDRFAIVGSTGNVGIGTTSPYARLSVVSGVTDNSDVIAVSTSTSGAIFRVTGYGNVVADGTITGGGADYAEYFYTQYTNLEPGETVCIDLLEKNAVKRCYRGHDNNVMGIVSTKPSILGNSTAAVRSDPEHYVIVGMLGQVDALVSAENGPINIGDSLTSASSTPGYAMRADGGDSTVGVALEPFPAQGGSASSLEAKPQKGKIKVLISRRNKSLAVEEVEALVVERIANMKIEDQVQAMIKQAVDSLNLDPKIQKIAQEEAGKLDQVLSVKFDDVNGQISNFQFLISNKISNLNEQMKALAGSFHITDSQGQAIFSNNRETGALPNREVAITADSITLNASSTAITGNVIIGQTPLTPLSEGGAAALCLGGVCKTAWPELTLGDNIKVDESGRIVIGNTKELSSEASELSSSEVQIVDPTEITASSSRAAFVVNQQGDGQIADFQSGGVSVMNIDNQGEVKIMGNLLVDGRIMLCTGGNCSNALDAAVDETMADLGVEGKVVAGAFEGYCDEGYAWVPGSAKYGTLPGFCVMSDLAKTSPQPSPSKGEGVIGLGEVITNVSQGEAQYACNSLGAGYHLISENEWLTIAENILQVNQTLGVSADPEGLKLTNDNIINNLTGSLGEWTNQNVTAAGLPVTPARDGWFEYGEVSDFKGLNIAPDYYLTDANNHIGKIYVGSGAGLRGFVRGTGGIYGLDLSHAPGEQNGSIGFRCAK